MQLRAAIPHDFAAILALNAESVAVLSPLDAAGLAALHARADAHWVVERDGAVVAFLLALREGADYASPNYRWFAARHARFLYVDRVVVARALQGAGAGTLLYRRLFAHAAETDAERVVCEYDVEPPNPQSQAFHARFGFREVGQQRVAGGKKRVSLQAAELRAR
jgi:predicted GNAT superfamily acetyltransferase